MMVWGMVESHSYGTTVVSAAFLVALFGWFF